MGGTSKTTQTQNSTTAPWAEAQPMLSGILGQIQTGLSNTGLTGAETGAIDALSANAGNAGRFAPQIEGFASSLLGGGGALDQAGRVNQAYDAYLRATQPVAGNTDYNPLNTPGFKDAIATTVADITNATNGQFAAAGRDFSGANSQALGRGIMAGVAPTIAAQYNANREAQLGTARDVYAAGTGNAGILSGLQREYLENQGRGVAAASAATDAGNASARAALEAEAMRRGIPLQNLGFLAQIGVPIAGLGSQSTGTMTGTQTDSGMKQFLQFGQGVGGLIPKGPMTFNF